MSFRVTVGPLTITTETLHELDAAVTAVRSGGYLSAAKALVREYDESPADRPAEEVLEAAGVLPQQDGNPPIDIAEWNKLQLDRAVEKDHKFAEQVEAAKPKQVKGLSL